jgi:pimeloyl-ACP methyl ester carboxylesterase
MHLGSFGPVLDVVRSSFWASSGMAGIWRETGAVAAPAVTSYARSGDVHIAYQVVGSGPFDLVFSPSPVSNIEVMWEWPPFARFLHRLASFSRLIVFDKRGTGLSDRVTDAATLEERMDDVRAVMDAAGSKRAAIFGSSEGGPMALLFTAMYPERVSSLVLYGSYAKSMNSEDYSSGVDSEIFEMGMQLMAAEWGNCALLDVFCPSMRDNHEFREWWARYERQSASPGAAVAIQQLNAKLDVRAVLPAIQVPTLIVYRAGEFVAHVEGSRYLARHIAGAEYVELEGVDYHPYVGDQDAILDPIEEFLTGSPPQPTVRRGLVVVMTLGGSCEPVDVERFGGRLGITADGTTVVMFDGPARAVQCGLAIAAVRPDVRIGLHVGEVEERAGRVAGDSVDLCEQVRGCAAAGQVVVSRTMADLVPGADLTLTSIGVFDLPGGPDAWELFSATPSSGAARASAQASFRREGDVWMLEFAGRAVRVHDMKGMHDLAALLAQPHRELHVAELMGTSSLNTPSRDDVLDSTAIAEYRKRLAELADDAAEADERNDIEGAARARDEREALVSRLSADLRIGGTARAADDWTERARKAVRLRITNALKRIEANHLELGRHLRSSIRTGAFCSYEPVEEIFWRL